MSDPAKSRWGSIWRPLAGALVAFTAFLILLLAVAIESPWFERRARQWVEAEASRFTGTPVRIGRMHWSVWRQTVTFDNVAVHGTEAEDETPLFAAKSIQVRLGLRTVLSSRDRRARLEELRLTEPRIQVRVYADGSTNLPAARGGPPATDALIDLAIGKFELSSGTAAIEEHSIPLDAEAANMTLVATWRTQPDGYTIRLTSQNFTARKPGENISASVAATVDLLRDRLVIASLRAQSKSFDFEGRGQLSDWRQPSLEMDGRVHADAHWAAKLAGVAGVAAGRLSGDYRFRARPASWRAEASLKGTGLDVTAQGERIRDASVTAQAVLTTDGLELTGIRAALWDGAVTGRAKLSGRVFEFKGALDGVHAPRTVAAAASGPLTLVMDGGLIRKFESDLGLKALDGPLPLGGALRVSYDAAEKQLRIDTASLLLANSRVNASGSAARGLQFELRTRDLEALMVPLRTLTPMLPEKLPVTLAGGLLLVSGRVDHVLTEPRVTASLEAEQVSRDRYTLHRVRAQFEARPDEIVIRKLASNELEGQGRVSLRDWTVADESVISGEFNVRDFDLAALSIDVTGRVSASASLSGTVKAPQAEGRASVVKPAGFGLDADAAEAAFSLAGSELRLRRFEARRGIGRLEGNASYQLPVGDGVATQASAGLSLQNWPVEARVPFTASGRVTVTGDMSAKTITPQNVSGAIKLSTARYGDADLRLETADGRVRASISAAPFGARVEGEGSWKLDSRGEGSARLRLTGLRPDAVDTALPFTGLIEGTATVDGSLGDWRRMVARAQLSQVRLVPKQQTFPAGITASDLTLRNDGDVIADADLTGLVVERFRMVAKDTELEAFGGLSFRTSAWNLLMRGRVNLAVMGTLRNDLLASGVSTINARLRGSLENPQLDGRMQLANASLQLRDVPNGLENINGTVLFDRTRATVESASAESGGGRVSLSGFLGFSRELTYQLAARLDQVRVRYPAGVSTQVNALLNLTGGSKRSLLSGSVTILRAALTGASEAVALASRSNAPILPEDNEFLKNQQFDIRVETAQSAQFSTELSREVQADVDLRLRGTPLRPALLGRVSVTRGVISFFGTDYRINRGEVNFLNPVRIEPQVDLDLETTVRGIVVSINFAGPLEKMNMSYRSDPPLQAQEILALLAVGRTPASATSVGVGTLRGQELLSGSGGNAVINSALAAAPTSTGGLQRFFGISRLKIDPQLIGIDNTPQARLSVEQQLSPVISLTYVTNLNRAQQQLVRVQWDLTRQWSAIATRDENGVLSVDFVFRRSFK